jgi:hypothetical protein
LYVFLNQDWVTPEVIARGMQAEVHLASDEIKHLIRNPVVMERNRATPSIPAAKLQQILNRSGRRETTDIQMEIMMPLPLLPRSLLML